MVVRPSKPKLMAQVLDAVTHLSQGKGSTTRDVLDYVRKGGAGRGRGHRNLTLQVQRALRNAVTAGLIKLSSGRYKSQITLKSMTHISKPSSQKSMDDEVNTLRTAATEKANTKAPERPTADKTAETKTLSIWMQNFLKKKRKQGRKQCNDGRRGRFSKGGKRSSRRRRRSKNRAKRRRRGGNSDKDIDDVVECDHSKPLIPVDKHAHCTFTLPRSKSRDTNKLCCDNKRSSRKSSHHRSRSQSQIRERSCSSRSRSRKSSRRRSCPRPRTPFVRQPGDDGMSRHALHETPSDDHTEDM